MRSFAAVALATAGLLLSQTARAGDASALVGEWNVISSQTHGSCGLTMGGTIKSETWEIAISGNEVTATVIPARKRDQPVYPVLTGTWDASTDTLVLTGGRVDPAESVDPFLWWKLVFEDGRLTGTRRYLGVVRNRQRPEALAGGFRPCFEDSDVEATHSEE